MIKTKKQMFIMIGSYLLFILLGTVTYAFFNYTRIGTANTIKVGRLAFNSEQGNSINLTNVFPIDKTTVNTNTDNVGTVTIHVTGDTTYDQGIEYVVKAVNVHNTIDEGTSKKNVPVNLDISYEAANGKVIGTEDEDYFTNRGGNTSRYKITAGRTVYEGSNLLVGYIKPDATGVDGNITIKAYIDKDSIAISDTYPESNLKYWRNEKMTQEELNACISYMTDVYGSSLRSGENAEGFCKGTGKAVNYTFDQWISFHEFTQEDLTYLQLHNVIDEYQNGTTDEWANGRVVFTTDEWNSFNTNGISFQVKVEANEGIWVPVKGSAMGSFPDSIKNLSNSIKKIYFNQMDKDEMHDAYANATIKADLTYNDEGEVLAWLVPYDELEDGYYQMYDLYIASETTTELTTGRSLFMNFTRMNEIQFNNINTSRVEDMYMMFAWNYGLRSIDLSSFDTSNVEDMGFMFYYNGLESLDIHFLNMKKVKSLAQFASHSREHFKSVNMSGLELDSVTNMVSMFYGNENMTEADLSHVKTPNVELMGDFFFQCFKLEKVYLSDMGSDNLKGVGAMFSSNGSLKEIDMTNFNFGTTSITYLFGGLSSLETIDLTGAKVSNVTEMNALFSSDSKLKTIYASSDWDLPDSVQTNYMFGGCTSLVGGNNTSYDNNNPKDKTYAKIDREGTPGYFTLKTN